ncbi:MAG: pentapeptide repeat-containing protein [Segniliparus sp.]|uniref:pentapeptide repeat-containing protein n=1 Tax=Segniliparus sp. TaxID=2804064 RepID=UPI003F2AF5B2
MVALTVAYRKQRAVEQGRFVERFGAAAAQLGSPDAAVRIAGVYAMAAVADESSGSRRQQCVDVLCGYLRLPYSPEQGKNHQSKLVRKHTSPGGSDASASETEEHFEYRQDDSEVRKTICRVVHQHLLEGADASWSTCDFDFTGVYFEGLDFERVLFSGKRTDFDGASFNGNVSFVGAKFSGDSLSFAEAHFGPSSRVEFSRAEFHGGKLSFIRPDIEDGAHFEWDEQPAGTAPGFGPGEWPPFNPQSESSAESSESVSS